MVHESLEFPSLATDENLFSSAGSLGNIKDALHGGVFFGARDKLYLLLLRV